MPTRAYSHTRVKAHGLIIPPVDRVSGHDAPDWAGVLTAVSTCPCSAVFSHVESCATIARLRSSTALYAASIPGSSTEKIAGQSQRLWPDFFSSAVADHSQHSPS